MATTTIMTPYEVLKKSKFEDMAGCDLNDILQVEQSRFRKYLGSDFREVLLNDLVDYSAATVYLNGTTYNQNDNVVYMGLIYTVTATTTTNEPTVESDWSLARKFTTDCYENLYCLYLSRYLSMCITKNSIPPVATPLTRNGVIVRKGLHFDGASHQDVTRLSNWSDAEIQDCYDNMVEWIGKQVDDADCFALFTPYVEATTSTAKTTSVLTTCTDWIFA